MAEGNVVPLMNSTTLRKRIAAVALDSSQVQLTKHALARMAKRGVVLTQILKVLQKGVVVENAHQNIHGNWQCTLEHVVAGDRIKVAAALVVNDGDSVVVLTVMN